MYLSYKCTSPCHIVGTQSSYINVCSGNLALNIIKMPACLSKFTDVECHVVGHTWDPSCSGSAIRVFINCMKYSWQLYTPLYTVSAKFEELLIVLSIY